MNQLRNTIVRCVFIGSCIAFAVFLFPSFYSLFSSKPWFVKYRFLEIGLLLWLLIILIAVFVHWSYKRKIKKDPLLRAAVYDERVKTNWLNAYRFAFYAIVIANVAYKVFEVFIYNLVPPHHFALPHTPWLTLFVALIGVTGSFLYFNREAKDG